MEEEEVVIFAEIKLQKVDFYIRFFVKKKLQLQTDLRGNFNKIAFYQFSVFTNCKNGHWKNQDFNLILLKLEKIATI